MAINLKDIIKSIGNFRWSNKTDVGINSIVKDAAPISTSNYKTIVDALSDLRNKISTSNKSDLMDLSRSIQGIIDAGGFNANISNDRVQRYKTYDSMVDAIPIVKRSLWLYTANILSPDDITKVALKYEPAKRSKKDLTLFQSAMDQFRNIADELKIDNILEELIFDTLKYGDAFVEITIADERFRKILTKKNIPVPKESDAFTLEFYDYSYDENTPGSKNVLVEAEKDFEPKEHYPLQDITLISRRPYNIIKLQNKQLLLGYLFVETADQTREELNRINNEFDMTEIVNKLALDISQFLKQYKNIKIDEPYIKSNIASILELNEKLSFTKMTVRFIPPDRMVHFKIPSSRFYPYGESWLSGLEFDARLYLTDKVATVVHRVARAGERRVVYVEVGVDPDAQKYIERVKNQIIKKEVAWNESDIDTLPSTITPFETIYIPRRNGQAFVEFDNLNTGQPISERIETNNELKNSLANGMSVPGNLLGLPEWSDNRVDLTQQNVTFARLVISLQKKFTEFVTELFRDIYKLVYFKTEEYSPLFNEVIVTFNPPQNILLESITNSYTSIANIAETLSRFGVPQEMIAKKFIPDLDWDEIERAKLQNKENQEAQAGY